MDLDETKESLPLDVFMFVVIYSVDLSEHVEAYKFWARVWSEEADISCVHAS